MILTDTGVDALLWLVRVVMWLSIAVVVVGVAALVAAALAWGASRVRASWLPTQLGGASWADTEAAPYKLEPPPPPPPPVDEQVGNEAAWMPLDEAAREQWETWIREEGRRE